MKRGMEARRALLQEAQKSLYERDSVAHADVCDWLGEPTTEITNEFVEQFFAALEEDGD